MFLSQVKIMFRICIFFVTALLCSCNDAPGKASTAKILPTASIDTATKDSITLPKTKNIGCNELLQAIVLSSDAAAIKMFNYTTVHARLSELNSEKATIELYVADISDASGKERSVENTVGWLAFYPKTNRLYDITNDPDNPVELHYNKSFIQQTDFYTICPPYDMVKQAEKAFTKYLPKILKSRDGVLDVQQSYTGDFTGDGIEDVAIYFSLSPADGGNAIVGRGLALYKNEGNGVKVIAGYEPEYLFIVDTIINGKIIVEKMEYAPEDGRCCPSIRSKHKLSILGNKVY